VPENPSLIRVCCYHTLEAASVLRAEINALNLQSARPDPFSTFDFLEAYLRHDEFRSMANTTLWFLTAVKAGRLLGYVALSHEQKSFLGVQSSTIGFAVIHDTDRPHVVARLEHLAEVSDAIFRYLLARRREWSLLEFQQQDDTSSLFPPPSGIARGGLGIRQWPSLANGTILVRWKTFPEYLGALTKKNRSNVSRQVRHLLSVSDVEVLESSDPAVTPVMLELYRSIEPRSWKSATDATIGRHPSRIAYFEALLGPQQPMRVSIHILLQDGMPVAGLICGSFLDSLYALHIVYDESLAVFAPGSLMLLMGIRQAIVLRIASFNLLSGFGYFKVRWLATMTETRNGQIYRVGRPPFWRRLVGDGLRWTLRVAAHRRSVLFNPARRAARGSTSAAGVSDARPRALFSCDERTRLGALVAQVRRGRTTTVSAAALAVLWPTDRAVTPPHLSAHDREDEQTVA
jgi:hypothetical protein